MTPAQLRAEFRRRTGRDFRGSDARLLALIEEARARRPRRFAGTDYQSDAGPVHRLSIPIPLGMPEGTGWPEDRAPARRGPEAGDEEVGRPAPPVGVPPWYEEVRAVMAAHPSARNPNAAPEFERPDLRPVPSPEEDGEPRYAREEPA